MLNRWVQVSVKILKFWCKRVDLLILKNNCKEISGDTCMSAFWSFRCFTSINIVPFGQRTGKSQILKTRTTNMESQMQGVWLFAYISEIYAWNLNHWNCYILDLIFWIKLGEYSAAWNTFLFKIVKKKNSSQVWRLLRPNWLEYLLKKQLTSKVRSRSHQSGQNGYSRPIRWFAKPFGNEPST